METRKSTKKRVFWLRKGCGASCMLHTIIFERLANIGFQPIIFQMLQNSHSRMSRLTDRNVHPRTDNLYEPLRNALRKSTVSPTFLSPHTHSHPDNRLSASRIAQNVRALSPAETEVIKRSIFIPVNKELVPTRNLQKVMGKQFVTVDVEEKVGEAISPAEFSRVKTGTVEEIVYEVKDDAPTSIYTTNCRPAPPFAQMRPSYPVSMPFQQQQVYASRAQLPVNAPPPYPSQPALSLRLNATPRSPAGNPAENAVLRQSQGMNKALPYYQSTVLQTVKSEELLHDPTAKSARSLLENKQPISNSQSSDVRAYGFRQSTASKEDAGLWTRKDREYKYNLFSLIDEGGNNGCKHGCFGSNQIFAPKISSNPWK